MERKRGQGIPGAIALLIVVFVCVVALLCSRLIVGITGRSVYDSRSIDIPANQAVKVVSDGFIYYDGSSIASVTTDAKVKWSYLIGSDAGFDASDYGVAAWKGSKVTLIESDTGNSTATGDMDSEVLSARVGERYAAVVLGPEHDSTIVLLERGGRKVNSITLTSQTIIDYGFFSKGSLLWVMSLDTSGTAPSCTINTYRPGKERVGMIHDSEQLMYGVVFQSAYFCCAGNTYLKVYDYTGNEDKTRRRLVYGWYMAALDDAYDDPMMAFVPSNQYDAKEGMRDLRMIRAKLDQQVRFPYGCQYLIARGKRVYGFSTAGFVCIAEQGVLSARAFQLPIAFDRVYGVTGNDYAVLGSGNTIHMLKLT